MGGNAPGQQSSGGSAKPGSDGKGKQTSGRHVVSPVAKIHAAAQKTQPARKAPRRNLTPSEIKYLAFEGGGGKGFAYLGALEVLEKEQKLLEFVDAPGGFHKLKPPSQGGKIHGIAGASAGAITALLVSCGYNSDRIKAWMDKTRFGAFFDPPDPREVVGPFNYAMSLACGDYSYQRHGLSGPANSVTYVRTSDGKEYREPDPRAFRSAKSPALTVDFKKEVLKLLLATSPVYQSISLLRELVESDLIKFAELLIACLMSDAPAVREALNPADLRKYIDYLSEEMGMFSGCYARAVFAQTLADSMPEANGGRQFDVTFKEHHDYFGTDLVLMGTNLATQKSVEFSWANTPHFPVADAVRISMSIPIAFKPVVIPDGGDANLAGVWVDGGVANNTPFRVFDYEPGPNPKTLVLRLENEPPPRKIGGLFSFLASYASFAFLGAGEAGISEQYGKQAIIIDTGNLSLLNFTPDPKIADPAVANAKAATRKYFAEAASAKEKAAQGRQAS